MLLAVLNALMAEGIPALGLHDGPLVQQSKKEIAKRVMEEAARDIVGAALPVSEKY